MFKILFFLNNNTMKKLELYNQKRDFSKTKEPIGKKMPSSGKIRFCIQHHRARKDHFDFRLEVDGVLKSWAIPKGPSYDAHDKRLAVMVEDHPLSYRLFEGVIPKGAYGGGEVMLWDQGYWFPITDVTKGLKDGSLKFILFGKRLFGKWALFRIKEEQWILIKEKDEIIGFNNIDEYNLSIKTGRTMEEIKEEKNIVYKNVVESIRITHPDKLVFPKYKITKMDIVNYYERVASFMLPFLEKRIVSVKRCPKDFKDAFFMKHLESNHLGIGKVNVSNDKHKNQDYYYILDKAGLISEVQMNSYEFHIWGSNIVKKNHPDMMVFDLDPDEKMSIKKVREGVKDLKQVLDELGLISFLKTSGGKGYHVVVPFRSIKSWKVFTKIAKDIAKVLETKFPDKYVSNMRIKARKGKIFIDWMRNTKGATSVAPYSLRLKNKPRISMPISWDELDKIKPDEITIEEALKRIKKRNPWENFFSIFQ